MQDSLLNAFPPADVHAVGVVAVDASGRQIYVNQAFADMLGWSAEELTGAAPPYVYWPTEEIEHIRAAFLQPIQGDTPTPLKVKFRRKCGERFDALLSISQLCAEGIAEGWVAAVADASFHTEILPIALFLREAEVK